MGLTLIVMKLTMERVLGKSGKFWVGLVNGKIRLVNSEGGNFLLRGVLPVKVPSRLLASVLENWINVIHNVNFISLLNWLRAQNLILNIRSACDAPCPVTEITFS
ncbi:hypothetical protein NPIL_170841 [Nephila pilipes]|uniref:Uncharacterized protein n=1 Tax=Nephila pilipes TaxID=299642 RepID=A0A8X6PZV2_NEPPI|nr:hypothetical protein NPIL_170841 [Nephila pilipes]